MANRQLSYRRWLHLAHRYVGLTIAAFVLVLAITGVMLNHGETLALDSKYVRAAALLDWYGIERPAVSVSFRTGRQWVTRFGERVYLDRRALPQSDGVTLHGAVILGEIVAIAGADELLLYTTDGELIERLGAVHGVPVPIRQIGAATDRIVLRTDKGDFVSDAAFLAWQPTGQGENVQWQVPVSPPSRLTALLTETYQGKGLPLERVVQDVHSGRILGTWGVYLMDAVAAAFVLLAAAGIWMWASRPRQRRGRG